MADGTAGCKLRPGPGVDRVGERGGALIEEAELAPVLEERAIVARLQGGDRSALGVLYQWYGEALYREVILPRLPYPDLAEDVLRDTFRKLLERIDQYQPEPDRSIYFWIRRIAINHATDVHRARQRQRRLESAVEAEERVQARVAEPEDPSDRDALRARIEAALAELNPRYAEALRLRLLDDLDRDACAQRMGVTLGNFDVILHRAAQAFKRVYRPPE